MAIVLCAAAGGRAEQPENRVAAAFAAFAPPISARDRECMARAMYFESAKTAEDGMLAVGTVVANRLRSGRYGSTVCGVVGQRGQFAPGVLTRRMEGRSAERARRVAEAVLTGRRHPGVRGAMFFHAAGLRFGYPNMRYVLVAGGNAFYEKRDSRRPAAGPAAPALAFAEADASSLGAGFPLRAEPGGAGGARLRVVSPAAPVEASLFPVPRAAPASPKANILVAEAWAAFPPIRR